jgi:hypothetical protein
MDAEVSDVTMTAAARRSAHHSWHAGTRLLDLHQREKNANLLPSVSARRAAGHLIHINSRGRAVRRANHVRSGTV